uniref:RRM domain-containing protein n=1 Tax=Strigamia maritima TaxID=126957 RepID=T1J6B8_STRMM
MAKTDRFDFRYAYVILFIYKTPFASIPESNPLVLVQSKCFVMDDSGLIREDKLEKDSRSIFLSNVSYHATIDDLKQHFHRCGPINRVTIPRHGNSGNPKGFAYIEFAEKEAVIIALAMHNSQFLDRQLKIDLKRGNRDHRYSPRRDDVMRPDNRDYIDHCRRNLPSVSPNNRDHSATRRPIWQDRRNNQPRRDVWQESSGYRDQRPIRRHDDDRHHRPLRRESRDVRNGDMGFDDRDYRPLRRDVRQDRNGDIGFEFDDRDQRPRRRQVWQDQNEEFDPHNREYRRPRRESSPEGYYGNRRNAAPQYNGGRDDDFRPIRRPRNVLGVLFLINYFANSTFSK